MLKNFYWGSRREKLWTSGYFCETVGNVSESMMIEYVSNQGDKTPLNTSHSSPTLKTMELSETDCVIF